VVRLDLPLHERLGEVAECPVVVVEDVPFHPSSLTYMRACR
jgi:hypothetical protein